MPHAVQELNIFPHMGDMVIDEKIAVWDLTEVPVQDYLLKLTAVDRAKRTNNAYYLLRIADVTPPRLKLDAVPGIINDSNLNISCTAYDISPGCARKRCSWSG